MRAACFYMGVPPARPVLAGQGTGEQPAASGQQLRTKKVSTSKRITQLSVFLENRSGRISSIASVLGEAGVDIRAMSLADNSDFGILRLIVADNDGAIAALKARGFIVKRNEVVAVEIPDEAGSLAKTLDAIEGQGLNIEYLYAIIRKPGEYAVLVFRFDDVDNAIACLDAANIRMLSDADIAGG